MNVEVAADRSPSSRLMQDLLHAMGQPLTSLQMCALLRDRPSVHPDTCASVLRAMAEQVELLSKLFGTLRRVADWEGHSLQTTPAAFVRLLQEGMRRWHTAALRRDVTIRVTGIPGAEEPAYRPPCQPLASCMEAIVDLALKSTPERGLLTFDFLHKDDASCLLRIRGGDQLADSS